MNNLHVDSVRKTYRDKLILTDIFLSCKQGEIVGLIGRNGSGKSTLLKIIFGIENAENKFIRVNKKILQSFKESSKVINYLPQNNFLPKGFKIKTIINLFLPVNKRARLKENVFIKPLLQKKYQVLSGGEKRILEILLLLNSEADFVLLDEPFNGVSPIVREQIIKYITDEKPNKGFIITDHDYENVMRVSDKILFLKNAGLKKITDKMELIQHGYLTKTT
ncbi:ABC-type multidrug transport system, ATPase component [Gillisia sp. Hel1_33_143]|uniref:ATP-binding cassette domain-containing protein n=1 Tax=Gillisia sp. Hel1_33_143 TaxID=1336796 RepID=UPI00087C218C|nr:ATP-binding cassette domain-containing protein [Gillisia sp. Hel1_33_143]SDS68731.1 ABC-type multidrug transport system, ATPase component [Gillisia sp. Hel1_33_143]